MVPLESIWAIEPAAGERLAAAIAALTPADAAAIPRGLTPALPMEMVDAVAVIDIAGPLTKRPGLFQLLFGGTSTEQIGHAVARAAGDERAKAILLRVDSPGGSVDGLAAAGDAIFAARQQKPVYAQVCGTCCSAAYHLASQAERIFAERMDVLGSIGVRAMYFDFSKAFDRAGIRAVPIDSGPYKSAGAMGTVITPEQEQYFKSIVESFFADFRQAITRGRGLTGKALEAVADGRVFVAGEALKLRLIDGIQTVQTTLSRLADRNGASPLEASEPMTQPTAATLAELRAACPGASDSFLLAQLDSGATLADAQKAFIVELQKRPAGKAGVTALGDRRGPAKEPQADAGDFDQLVRERIAAGMTRRAAVIAVAREFPEAHRAYVEANNPARVQHLIADRFGG